ncbi:MAG: hypothetical protein ACKO13_15495 [Cytophagales bacterium]
MLHEIDSGINKEKLNELFDEVNQLTSIYVASLKTMRSKLKAEKGI